MNPPVFAELKNDPAVVAALWWPDAPGGPQLKLYPFGSAPEGVEDPYCVWRVQGGAPNNFLGERPNTDLFAVQFDVYGSSPESVRLVGRALRDAIEPRRYITAWLGDRTDPQTKRCNLTFSSDWWVNR